ncbi:Molybdopterin-guanine dinucleotide biosynthesis protein A [Streptacidiphilus jiangxiensis]|uniref:Molybdopterin-guanine dinucleotide biosynthesis protein A n=1 Tax=Streptacidiphilus jiangxiensis TaxID=235985 RepID=A0A1H7JGU8_STRJI|nr:Molybdopterin-guanine dinucleotide biosynthesis protein A [Streptacidiphilus jiangxiensis]
MSSREFDAVVLAGGAASRLGGEDKPALLVAGTSLLDRVLAACDDAEVTVVVGPERATRRAVRWVREEPPGGGPVAGLAAGMGEVAAEVTLLLAADLPFLDSATVRRLLEALAADPELDAAVLVDAGGRDQLLTAAYRTAPLRAALAAVPQPHGARLRAVTGGLRTVRLRDEVGAAVDCDTWEDVERARERAAHTAPPTG